MAMYFVIFIFIGIVALVGTIFAGIQINKSMEKLEGADEAKQEEILKANHFKNHRTNLKVLTWIYGIVFLLAIIIYVVYLYFD